MTIHIDDRTGATSIQRFTKHRYVDQSYMEAEWPAFMRDSLSTQVLNAQPHTVSGIRRDRIDPMAAALPL